MPTKPKSTVQSARKGSTTLKSSKPPTQQFEPRHPRERKGQGTMWRWTSSPGTSQTRTLERRDV